ncbi:hypothetical protein [Spirochaeta isovalerica]|uniref:Uncharacterized protein n=1 Tax=Spirochaeta isovalerica TaxID=150 RepID=A0A841RBE1_9SPIO|nr:hypothetical protein [Spirochaeta isovalerica]MBB6482724.1 hypothetical protein [Spirochaeta isovalerica]
MRYTQLELAVLYLFKAHNATKTSSMAFVVFNTEIYKLCKHDKEKVEYAIRFADEKGWIEASSGNRYIWPSIEAEQIIYWGKTKGELNSMDIKEKKAARYKFLNELYNATGGSKNELISAIELGKKIGLENNLSHDVAQYLSDEGLLEFAALGGIIRITHGGIQEIENAHEHPDIETKYFPPVNYINNIINIGGNSNAPIQMGNTNSTQVSNINNSSNEEILKWIENLEKAINEEQLKNQELNEEIDTVKFLISKKNPKMTVIQESMNIIKNILLGVASNTVFQGLLAAFPM